MQKKTEWVELLRAMACMMVVMLHAAAPYVLRQDVSSDGWAAANLIDAAMRSCVPLFFMISGYLFFGDRQPQEKHFARILAALTFYSALALVFIWIVQGSFPVKKAAAALTTPVFYHLWFFYAILGIYLVAFIVQIRQPTSAKMVIAGVVAIVFINETLGSFLLGEASAGSKIFLVGKSVYFLLYAICGAVLGRVEVGLSGNARRVALVALVAAAVASSFMIAFLTEEASRAAGAFVADFYAYEGPFVAVASLSLFGAARLAGGVGPLKGAVGFIAERSLVIYGIHALILAGVFPRVLGKIGNVAAEVGVIFALTLLGSLTFASLVRRVDRQGWVS